MEDKKKELLVKGRQKGLMGRTDYYNRKYFDFFCKDTHKKKPTRDRKIKERMLFTECLQMEQIISFIYLIMRVVG